MLMANKHPNGRVKKKKPAPRKPRTIGVVGEDPPELQNAAPIEAGRVKCRGCQQEIWEGGNGLCWNCNQKSTTLPDGIAAHDPDVVRPEANGRPAPQEELGEGGSVFVAELARNRFNPRRTFDEKEMQELADSLALHGLLQPILVRPIADMTLPPRSMIDGALPARFEIVCGERRALAAAKLGWAEIPATVRAIDDLTARELGLVENLDRQDLNDLDKAQAFVDLMRARQWSAAVLANQLGRSEAYVANLVRLLDLPADWKARILSQEIPPTHARYLLPYKDVAGVSKDLAKRLKSEGAGSVKEWERQIHESVRDNTASLSMHVSTSDFRKSTQVTISPAHPRFAELRAIEVPNWHGTGKEWRAQNEALAKKLLDEKANEWKAKQRKSAGKGQAAALSPAEAAAKKKRDAEDHKRALECWLAAWRLTLVAGELREASAEVMETLLAQLVSAGGDVAQELEDLVPWNCSTWRKSVKKSIWEFSPADVEKALDDALPKAFLAAAAKLNKYSPPMAPEDLTGLCEALSIDLAACWTNFAAGVQIFGGERTAGFFELHTLEDLENLAAEWKLKPPAEQRPKKDADAKEWLITWLTGTKHAKPLPLPKSIAALAKPPRKSPAKKVRGGK